jgi:hypothetical protein
MADNGGKKPLFTGCSQLIHSPNAANAIKSLQNLASNFVKKMDGKQ